MGNYWRRVLETAADPWTFAQAVILASALCQVGCSGESQPPAAQAADAASADDAPTVDISAACSLAAYPDGVCIDSKIYVCMSGKWAWVASWPNCT